MAVEASIAQLDRAVARVVIEIHAEILAWRVVVGSRFSDIVICGCHRMIASESRQPTGIRD
jgi:hypothetical protein